MRRPRPAGTAGTARVRLLTREPRAWSAALRFGAADGDGGAGVVRPRHAAIRMRCVHRRRRSDVGHVPRGLARWVAVAVQGSSGQGCLG